MARGRPPGVPRHNEKADGACIWYYNGCLIGAHRREVIEFAVVDAPQGRRSDYVTPAERPSYPPTASNVDEVARALGC